MKRFLAVVLAGLATAAPAQTTPVKIVDPTNQAASVNVETNGGERWLNVHCDNCSGAGGAGGGSVTIGTVTVDGGVILGEGKATTNAPTYTNNSVDPLSLTTSGALRTDSSATTQPVSAASLPLPAGAATEATLATLLTSGTFTARINTLGQNTMANSTPVVLASDQSAIPSTQSGSWSVSLLAGAATIGAVNQASAPWSFVGTLTNNNAAPSSNLLGALTARANAAAPTWTEGDLVLASVDLAGNIRTLTTINGTVTVAGTVAATQSGAWSVGQTGTWNVGLNAGSNTIGKVDQGVGGSSAWKVDGSAVTQPVSGTVTANAGTNLNTSLLQLDTTGAALNLAQASTTSGQTGPLAQGATTTAAPIYTTGKTNPLSLTTAGALRTDSSATTQPVSGTVTANAGSGTFTVSAVSLPLPTGAATETTLAKLPVGQASTTSGQSGTLSQGAVTTAAPTYTTGQTDPFSLTTAGALRTDSSATTQPISGTVTANAGSGTFTVSGTVTANAGTGNFAENLAQVNGTTVTTNNGTAGAGTQRVVIASDQTAYSVNVANTPTVTANAGTNLNTSALQLDTTGAKLNNAQASTTSGQTGPLMQGAVTTAAPTYTTAQTDPLSLTTAGALRVDGSGVTQPVSGTVTANAGSGTFTVGGTVTANQGTAAVGSGAWPVTVTDTSNTVVKPGDSPNNAIRVNVVAGGASGGTSSSFGAAFPASGTAAGFSDGTNMQGGRVFDVDTGAGTQYVAGANLRVSANGGSTEAAAGAGATNASTLRVVLPTDQTAIPATQSGSWTSTVTQGTAANLNAQVQGAAASGAAKAGNPVQVGGVFNTTQPTVTNGQAVEAQATARGALIVASGVDAIAVNNTQQGTASQNVAQFGGTNVVTGTGASGAGIPRVTVSNDSNVLASQSGTWNLNNISGTVSLPTGAATAANQTTLGSQTTKVNDGTNTMAVKAASTAAVAADPSAVVALSPNSPLPTGANTIGALTANQSVNVNQIHGTATSVNVGTFDNGTQRVAVAGVAVNSSLAAVNPVSIGGTDLNGNSQFIKTDNAGVLFTNPNAINTYAQFQQTITASGNGGTVSVESGLVGIFINVEGPVTGTNPTITVTCQDQAPDDTTKMTGPIYTSTTLTGIGTASFPCMTLSDSVNVAWTVTGTNPSFGTTSIAIVSAGSTYLANAGLVNSTTQPTLMGQVGGWDPANSKLNALTVKNPSYQTNYGDTSLVVQTALQDPNMTALRQVLEDILLVEQQQLLLLQSMKGQVTP